MNLDGKDPKVEVKYDEVDDYIESLIVYDGELTSHGEELYEEVSYEEYYDEEYYDDEETSYEDKTPTEEVTRADSPEEKEIIMHDMVIKVNKEKLEEELKRIRELKEKRRETRDIRYLEGK